MHKKQEPKPLGFFDKKITTSKKYKDVTSTINSGLTIHKVKNITANEAAKRRQEIFYRLSHTQLSKLFEEYEQDEQEAVRAVAADCDENRGPKIVTYTESSQALNQKPYLILDCRELEEYRSCHILQARNYSYTAMRRDQTHPEIYQFRNKEGAMIILYCDDERISREAAKLMVDRGIDNVFLLSGGLAEFAAVCSCWVEGPIPKHISPDKRSGLTRTALARISENEPMSSLLHHSAPYPNHVSSPTPSSRRSPTASRMGERIDQRRVSRQDDDGRSESGYSTKSNASVADSVMARSMARKGKF